MLNEEWETRTEKSEGALVHGFVGARSVPYNPMGLDLPPARKVLLFVRALRSY